MKYIFPLLSNFNQNKSNTVSHFDYRTTTDIKNISEIYSKENLLIIAEPGNGKSRFLKEIVINAPQNNKQAIFLDLKKIKEQSIDETIDNYQKRNFDFKKLIDNPQVIKDTKDYIRTDDFSLSNSSNIVVCLDALDEVKKEYQEEYLDKIIDFKETYSEVQIIISVRSYIFNDNNLKNLLNQITQNIYEIKPFHNGQITKYLLSNDFSENDIRKFWNRFSLLNSKNIVTSPRILELFVNESKQSGIENTLNKTKAELIETFVYKKLEIEKDKTKTNEINLTKRILEKLALVMEIYQSKEITKDELMSFFDDIQSGLSQGFLQNIAIENFYERSLLIPYENSIQFENSEFQEYLAAKELSRFDKVEQIVFDLVVDKELDQFYTSWYNTLKYLVELVPNLQIKLVDYIYKRQNEGEASFFDYVLSNNPKILQSQSLENKNQIFKQVLEYHQALNLLFFHTSRVYYLLEFISLDIENHLKNEFEEDDLSETHTLNLLYVLELALSSNKLTDKNYWKNKAIKIAQQESKNKHILENALEVISLSNDLDLLKPFEDKSKELGIMGRYIRICQRTNPNDIYVIDMVFDALQKGIFQRVLPPPNFGKVTEYNSLAYLLKKIFEQKYFNNNLDGDGKDNKKFGFITSNLDKIYDKGIEQIIIENLDNREIFSKINSYSFLRNLVLLIRKHNSLYIFELLEQINIQNFDEKYFKLLALIKFLLCPSQTELFIHKMLIQFEKMGRDKSGIGIFNQFRFSKNKVGEEIYKISSRFFEQNQIQEEQPDNLQLESINKRYEEFKYELEPNPHTDEYYITVFSFYKHNKENIINFITDAELERLRYLIDKYFENNSFEDIHISRKPNGENAFTINVSNVVPIIGDILSLLKDDKLQIDYQNYRHKILDFLPFILSNHNCSEIFELFPDITEEEQEKIINFYTVDRNDDTFITNIQNLFAAIRQYNLRKSDSILKKVILDEKNQFEDYIKAEALELLNDINPNYNFYKKVFKKLIENENNKIADKANAYLITSENPHQKEAIIWRIEELKKRIFSLSSNKDYPDANEISFHQNQFRDPLLQVSNSEYKTQFLELLEYAIKDIFTKGKEYEAYAVYVWEVVFAYFRNLTIHKSLLPFKEIEKTLVNYVNDKYSSNSILRKYYQKLKIEYLESIQKPDAILDCVRTYNNLKIKDYLNISSADDLLYLIIDVIENDIKNWAEKEGAYRFLNSSGIREKEDLIQKTLNTQFENGLLKRGLRKNEIHILREAQLLDNKRTDFIISYGFVGQILIEIKLTSNSELKTQKNRKEYKDKLLQYINGTKSDYGIFLIFQIDEENNWITIEPKLKKTYNDVLDKIKIIGYNCIR